MVRIHNHVYLPPRRTKDDRSQEEVPEQWRLLLVERLEFLRNKLALLPNSDEAGQAAVRARIEELERQLSELDLEEENRQLINKQ